ncbi:MAG: hypothetical protein AAF532_13480 [Planctomycetota bacterium]
MNVASKTAVPGRRNMTIRLSWAGQMVASVFWAVSVFVYGEFALGDWIQLAAAVSWGIANVAALLEGDA